MHSIGSIRSLTAAGFGWLLVVSAGAQEAGNAELQRMVTDLQIRNKVLEQGIAEANRAEKEASEQLAQVRERLEALGRDLLNGGDERLIQATADLQLLNERIVRLEGSAMRFTGSVADYLRTALAADPDARLRVESAMRELDEVLGLRQKPAPNARNSGSARRAKVMSIDKESGLLVLNIGEQQAARIGTTYRLYRGDQAYGTAVIADVRQSIAGAFVESREADEPVRLGDTAILETE